MPPYITTVTHRCGHSDIYLTPYNGGDFFKAQQERFQQELCVKCLKVVTLTVKMIQSEDGLYHCNNILCVERQRPEELSWASNPEDDEGTTGWWCPVCRENTELGLTDYGPTLAQHLAEFRG